MRRYDVGDGMIVGISVEFGEASESSCERRIERRVRKRWWIAIGKVIGNVRAMSSWWDGEFSLSDANVELMYIRMKGSTDLEGKTVEVLEDRVCWADEDCFR